MNCEAVEQAAERLQTEADQSSGMSMAYELTGMKKADIHLLTASIPVLFRALEKACGGFGGDAGPTRHARFKAYISAAEVEIEKERQSGT